MADSAVALAAGIVVSVAAAVACCPASPVGQVVFVPAIDPMPDDSGSAGLQIDACEGTPDGLRVVGHLAEVTGSISILVTSAEPELAGVRVGLAQSQQDGKRPGSVVGDFDVVLPWADDSARFMIQTEEGGVGSASACPEGT